MLTNFEKSRALQKRAEQTIPWVSTRIFATGARGLPRTCKKPRAATCGMWTGTAISTTAWLLGRSSWDMLTERWKPKVHEEIDNGVLFAMTSELEVAVIGEDRRHVPGGRDGAPGLFWDRSHHARLAGGTRAYTGREKVIKFEGMYHGFQDYLLFSTYSPVGSVRQAPQPDPHPRQLRHSEGLATTW